MKIKILQSIAGHADPRYKLADFGFAPGSVVDVAPELARAWIDGKIALAAGRDDKLTMPVEVYTLATDSPVLKAYAQAQADAKEKEEAAAAAKLATDLAAIDYAKAAAFLQARGYEVKDAEAAQALVAQLALKDLPGFIEELSAFEAKE